MPRIGIILGSTRPNRNGEQVARWVYDVATQRGAAEFELVDLRDYPLPHLDEPLPPSLELDRVAGPRILRQARAGEIDLPRPSVRDDGLEHGAKADRAKNFWLALS